jgi:excisionase family DNA binding protein
MSGDGENAIKFSTNPSALEPNSHLEPVYLTPDDVAAMLQLSSKSIYRITKADPSMPMLKIGGSIRFPRERLLRWLQQREQGRPRTRSLSAVHQNPASDQESARA